MTVCLAPTFSRGRRGCVPAFVALARQAGLDVTDDQLGALLQKPYGCFVVATQNTALLGGVVGQVLAEELEIFDLVVAPAAQRQGLGRGLVQHLIAARGSGCERVLVEVATDNAPALALYRALDFVQVGLRKDYYKRRDGVLQDAWLMRMSLL